MNGCGHGSSEVTLSKAWLKDVMTILAKEGFGVMSFMPTPANSCQSTIFDEISKELLAEIEAKAKSK